MTLHITNEAIGFLLFLYFVLNEKESMSYRFMHSFTHSLISELREGIYNDTKHDVQTNGGDNDEEGQVEQ